jgi:U5 small nuclear ribonucleoprotein component
MDDSLYDEFGNYLGPDLEEEEDDDLELEEEDNNYEDEQQEEDEEHVDESSMMQIDGTFTPFKRKYLYILTFNAS